ncbi:S9 family peptidase [bacterium (Candidatus Blackallbacteria) CG17_big_fil_post_rev_8_21_14_2_50_48_46]|uniref:S9 family peptidase n=1 Tax=bacterium (Candidatus Blackallbacteria) CG17_big_fil_post_rev_8_21_14_2_50_48_46 TaxID=2014261 RepID=A0A2M7G853_9BACT|nr:MAG: S9 family peptidase [bacterium (Candidatus Blackallbacteria) CG18_big_fil_WC_8_21_14_2_50_49_26]PIW18265.1 MAG: S9 family peptidase [bacterium (Candidatus Blackallbacteria) CG17_big_fil_post_rev_8_21_14_2_50_48_46]PIW49489.1 MAG: S9 family peptidase [bacterium (Candidatus Blackallbacteria) CG13_big_fil_rev_8_21_14_2_50_49_14]
MKKWHPRRKTGLAVCLFSMALWLQNSVTIPAMATTPDPLPYQQAPPPLDKLLNAPLLPGFSLSPDRKRYLLMDFQTWPEIEDLAGPELKLAGLRFNPENYAPSRNWVYTQLHLHQLENGKEIPVQGLPEQGHFANLIWSPNSKFLSFTHTLQDRVELWILNIDKAQAQRLSPLSLNKTFGPPCVWMPNSQALLCKSPVSNLSQPNSQGELPKGPLVMENTGKAAPGRTFQDLLKSPQDEDLFDYYLKGQLWRVQLDGKAEKIGSPALYTDFQPSPNGEWLLVKQIHRPYSYLFPASRFPLKTELWDSKGTPLLTVADLPLANRIPIARDAVRTGRRRIEWREDQPASLFWVEAQDQGDPSHPSQIRDRLFDWKAPFQSPPRPLLDLPDRFDGVFWKNESLALVYSKWHLQRRQEVWHLSTGKTIAARKIAHYSSEDRYADPGWPLLERSPQGGMLLQTTADGKSVFLSGEGASPEGDRPFLDSWNPLSGEKKRLWQSQAPTYEQMVGVLDPKKMQFLTRRETQQTPPNYILHHREQELALTHLKHPLPELALIQKEMISYTRSDGVKLNAILYLPPGYHKEQGPLPTVFWAYPREFKNAEAAGQVKGSPYSYIRILPTSPLVFLTQGYAVVDHPAMPIIGEGTSEPNDTYLKQLVASAQAAIDKVVSMGIADPKRLAIGGHSYGAFMTVNLLAHSSLFKTGIARSGAYNRTLTPFGFQSEERNFWQAPEVYLQMSPLMHADKIQAPLLLIHGQSDNNSGTYPMQSESLYQALKGLGKPVRLVLFPFESHSYQAKESLEHMLWEMVHWLDHQLKNTD